MPRRLRQFNHILFYFAKKSRSFNVETINCDIFVLFVKPKAVDTRDSVLLHLMGKGREL